MDRLTYSSVEVKFHFVRSARLRMHSISFDVVHDWLVFCSRPAVLVAVVKLYVQQG